MKINGRTYRSIWFDNKEEYVCVIDQTKLPHLFNTVAIKNWMEAAEAITRMVVRGAPLIGVMGAYGMALAMKENPSNKTMKIAYEHIIQTRPTAINLEWALNRICNKIKNLDLAKRAFAAKLEADLIAEEDVAMCEKIGVYGCNVIEDILQNKLRRGQGRILNILTHCNAGWLATVDWGTALAPIYKAHRKGIDIHVWVDETRPRNQGASLTTYELFNEGIPHTLIVDNSGGHLMQNGMVDAVIVGADRISKKGDVCNKIGTYLKALAAKDSDIPFYVAAPFSSIDWLISDPFLEIPIELRPSSEIMNIEGKLLTSSGISEIAKVAITSSNTSCFNPAFDITPAKLVTGLLTDRGVIDSNEKALEAIH